MISPATSCFPARARRATPPASTSTIISWAMPPVGDDGRWTFSGTADVAKGVHTLRVDGLDGQGKVVNRVEVPFFREDQTKMAEAPSLPPSTRGGNLLRPLSRKPGQGACSHCHRARQLRNSPPATLSSRDRLAHRTAGCGSAAAAKQPPPSQAARAAASLRNHAAPPQETAAPRQQARTVPPLKQPTPQPRPSPRTAASSSSRATTCGGFRGCSMAPATSSPCCTKPTRTRSATRT